MKSFTKKITLLFALLAATLGFAIFAACGEDGPDANAFTVTVVDENGAPYTGVRVQMCEIGEGAVCYMGVEVDENGKVVYKNDDASDRLEVHIQDLPDYMLYDTVQMNRGEAVTIKVTEHKPLGGDGTGVHDTITHKNGDDEVVMEELPTFKSFAPYVVEEGSYRANVSKVDKIVYYAFRAKRAGKYSVQSSGSADPRVYEVTGSLMTGWRDYGEETTAGGRITNGNRDYSANDKNFLYTFEIDQGRIEQSYLDGNFCGLSDWVVKVDDNTKKSAYGVVVMAVSVEDEASEGKDFCITFSYVGPLQGGTVMNYEVVKAEELLGEDSDLVYYTQATLPGEGGYWDDDGTFHPAAPDPDATTELKWVYRFKESETNTKTLKSILQWNQFDAEYMEEDGIYYLKNRDGSKGPMLVAYISPQGGHGAWDASLYDIAVIHGNQFAYFTEDENGVTRHSYSDTDKNGESFIGNYGLACNSDGVYPLTKELKKFLTWYTEENDEFSQWVNVSQLGLQKGSYFLYFCGYYRDGSEENPYVLTVSENNYVSVQADKVSNGVVNFPARGTYEVTVRDAQGVAITYDGEEYTAAADGTITISMVISNQQLSSGARLVIALKGDTYKGSTVKIAIAAQSAV